MNQLGQIVTAIDIGTTKIVAIVGRKNKNKELEIIGIGQAESTGVKRGVVLNIEETATAIQAAVERAQNMSGVRFTDVFVGIAGQHIKSIKNRGYKYTATNDNEITQELVDELAADMYKIPIQAGEEIIHVIPQNYIVDNETGVKQPVGMSGQRVEANFHIVIGQIASAKNIKKCINRAGLTVNNLILEPLASADAVLTADEKEAGVALVDIGGGTTDIAVFYDGIIRHTAVIPFGGNVVTNDIKEGCSILQRQAEQLKKKFGSAMSDLAPEDKVITIKGISGREPKEISLKMLASIIEARMEEIISAIKYEIENSELIDKLGAGIVLTGGGSLLNHLQQLVNLHTGLDVRLGVPQYKMTQSDADIKQTIYATSVGLLLKGFENLETSEYIGAKQEKPVVEEVKQVIQKPVVEEEEAIEERKEKLSFFSRVKSTVSEIFEDKDTRM